MTLHFFVQGKPIPQGSLSAFVSHTTKRIISPQKPALVAWRRLIAASAVSAIRNYSHEQLEVNAPKDVTLVFQLQPPKKLKNPDHITRPDLDKLVRSVLDALTGTLWMDDSQVKRIVAEKQYACAPDWPTGVWIKVEGP